MKRFISVVAVLAVVLAVFAAFPVNAAGFRTKPMIAAGYNHSLALKSDGTVWAWGENDYGQLGLGDTSRRYTPVQIPGLSGVVAVVAGGYRSVALKADGTVWEWGPDLFYVPDYDAPNFSFFDPDEYITVPTQIPGFTDVTSISSGWAHVLALKNDGTVWGYGYNSVGQLGLGDTDNRATPTQIPGLSNVSSIAAGYSQSFAVKDGGTVFAWGKGDNYKLGFDDGVNRLTPTQIPELSDITAVAVGEWHALALKSNGTILIWGFSNYSQLGFENRVLYSTPIQVPDLTGITSIAAGYQQSFATRSDGTVWAWGNHNSGRLGVGDYGTYDHFGTPTQVHLYSGAYTIAAGYGHGLALKSDGMVWAWGWNAYGQLGDGTRTERFTPVQVKGKDGAGWLNLLDVPLMPETKGDVDDDDSITAADALLALQIIVGKYDASPEQIWAARVIDEDDVPTAADAMLILKYALGLVDVFPCE